ncbi:MAG: hypothetical protein JNG90_12310, partial [Planctomycetaceae bacterium]|nr:hypothetical protein [Planctomycetaceae bacterium]
RARLPGADQPQEIAHLQTTGKPVAELLREYGETPANERNAVHRALGADAVAHLFGLRAGESANLLELAREARQQVPDRPKLAAELELGGWRRAAARPDRLSREALEAARDGLIRLDHFDEAQSLVQRWLRARRERLPADEAEDRIQLAEEHLQLANDRVQAAELYREAWGLVPDFREAAAGLRQLGYELVGGQWREASEIGSPADEGESFLRPGVSESDVVRRLRRPDRLTRTATRRGIIEQWNYAGPPALVIYLRRDVAGGSAVVTQVTHGD